MTIRVGVSRGKRMSLMGDGERDKGKEAQAPGYDEASGKEIRFVLLNRSLYFPLMMFSFLFRHLVCSIKFLDRYIYE